MTIDNNDGQSGGDDGGAHCSDKLRVHFGPNIIPSCTISGNTADAQS